jgi:trigger factor
MNIKRTDLDALNATLNLHIEKADYIETVEKQLTNYRKTAVIPGFRKGHVPASLITKKYRTPLVIEEINKIIQQQLNDYIAHEKLNLLGNPLPQKQEDINWEGDDFNFEFELGIAPEFIVDLKGKKQIISYTIKADDKTINDQIDRIRLQYGKITGKKEVATGDQVTGVFKNNDAGINATATFNIDKLDGKNNLETFIGSKPGDKLELKTKGLFADAHDLMTYLKIEHDVAQGLEVPVTFELSEVNTREKATLNQELFDKLFGAGVVNSEDELREKLREDASRQFAQQTDQKLLTDVTEALIDSTTFDLPATFLKRWIMTAGEQELGEEDAATEFERSEKGLRYQLIESKIMRDNADLQLKFEELQAYSRNQIRVQMAQFGHSEATDEEVDNIVARVLSNEEEVKRMSEQLQNEKMLDFFKNNANLKTKEVTYEEFIKEAYDA